MPRKLIRADAPRASRITPLMPASVRAASSSPSTVSRARSRDANVPCSAALNASSARSSAIETYPTAEVASDAALHISADGATNATICLLLHPATSPLPMLHSWPGSLNSSLKFAYCSPRRLPPPRLRSTPAPQNEAQLSGSHPSMAPPRPPAVIPLASVVGPAFSIHPTSPVETVTLLAQR